MAARTTDPTVAVTRRYHSPVREASARRTRAQIVAAAHALFLERGYARCSMADLAAAAGVARPTVLTVFPSKAAILRTVVDVAMAGDDEPVPVAERPWFRPVLTARTQADCLDAYAGACTVIHRRSAPVVEVVRRAADDGPETAALWDTLQDNRRHGARVITGLVRGLGPLPRGTTAARAADLMWLHNDPDHYRSLVAECGWTERAYTAWLSARMRDDLVGDGSTPSGRRRG